jgi:hypothetical protein
MIHSEKFKAALTKFNEENSNDPNTELVDGVQTPHEWVDAHRLHDWVLKLKPEADEALQLASCCQHIRRWERPRSDYPQNRPGYLKWRADLKDFHAETAARILREVGYPDEMIERVKSLNRKEGLPQDKEAQILEDALCLTFMEFELESFAKRKDEETMIRILRKTWKKMSEHARNAALQLNFPDSIQLLIGKALD